MAANPEQGMVAVERQPPRRCAVGMLPFLCLAFATTIHCSDDDPNRESQPDAGSEMDLDLSDLAEEPTDLTEEVTDLSDVSPIDGDGGIGDALDGDTGSQGHPPAPGELGAECNRLGDCLDGFCITDAMFEGFEGGYCSLLDCNPAQVDACGEYGACIELMPSFSACARTCEQAADCRSDQSCIGVCIPDAFTSEPPLPGAIQADDPMLLDLIDGIDPSRIEQRIAVLSGADPWSGPDGNVTITSRAVGSPDHELAIDYLTGELEAAGLEVTRNDFWASGYNCSNLEAVLIGTSPEQKPVLVTAHYDSTASSESNWDPYSDPAPGAVDNGTGVAFVLEMADVLAAFGEDHRSDRNVHFVLFDCEEVGLVGSERYVQELNEAQDTISCMLNVDMVGWTHPATPDRVWYVYSSDHQQLGGLGVEAFRLYSDAILVPTDNEIAGSSDHAPFIQAGMCAASLSTFPTLDTYHSFRDTADTVDWPFYTEIVHGCTATLAAWLYYGNSFP
ncbi:MAG: Zn-dependent exopeptidase M28 [Bradymonadales bacterium]|nr:Zn-dependent exopeptidase M28 [Bradymonadales bacterium]